MGTVKCRYCETVFNEELDRCPECGTKVKKKISDEYYEGELNLCLVATALSVSERDIICSILASEGVQVLLQTLDGGGTATLLGDPGGRTEIYVSKEDFEKASALLEELKNAPLEDFPADSEESEFEEASEEEGDF